MVIIRMATAPAVYALFCLIVLTQAVCASTGLSDGVAKFVPGCAEKCVLSFLDVNYEGTRCVSRPSLRCLCTTEGNTNFTLGEGAVQCITAEKRFGSCSDRIASRKTLMENTRGSRVLTSEQNRSSIRRTLCAMIFPAPLSPHTR